jgi:hypothetical protein
MKESIVQSRHWDNPEIKVRIDQKGIEVEISLEDFCKAVVAEIPHPAFTFTRKSLETDILGALEIVLNKTKEATNHAVH